MKKQLKLYAAGADVVRVDPEKRAFVPASGWVNAY
jgi:hypothetical protein